MEVRADGCQNDFMAWDGEITHIDDDVTEL
jgi:hypothetical protein